MVFSVSEENLIVFVDPYVVVKVSSVNGFTAEKEGNGSCNVVLYLGECQQIQIPVKSRDVLIKLIDAISSGNGVHYIVTPDEVVTVGCKYSLIKTVSKLLKI